MTALLAFLVVVFVVTVVEGARLSGRLSHALNSPKVRFAYTDDVEGREGAAALIKGPKPYFTSPYLECSVDSDCCPRSHCAWPARAVRGTSDHRTCILQGSGGVVPEIYCEPCKPVSARYRNGVCDPSTAKPYDKPMNVTGVAAGESSDENSDFGSEGSSFGPGTAADPAPPAPRRHHGKHVRHLPEVDVPGEAPHTQLPSEEIDDIAREVLLESRRKKCDQADEWCAELVAEGAPEVDPEAMLDKKIKKKLIREDMLELRQQFKAMEKAGMSP